MKFYTICVLVCYFAIVHGLFGPRLQEKLHQTEDACIEQTGAKLINIDRVRYNSKLPENGRLDNFAKCILKRYSILNDDDSVNEDVNKYYLISDDARKKQYAEECTVLRGKDNNETARKIFTCLLHKDLYIIDSEYRVVDQKKA